MAKRKRKRPAIQYRWVFNLETRKPMKLKLRYEPPTPKPSIKEYRRRRREEWRSQEHGVSLYAYQGGLPGLGKRR